MPEQAPMPATIAEPAPVPGPVRAKERIEVLDILRGWAVFGMLLVNMQMLSGAILLSELWTGTADQAALRLIKIFAQGKFWTLFSFLFGLGFVLQMGRAQERGARFFPPYRRRLFVLLLIGLALTLVSRLGILVRYALLGFLLFPFRTRSARTIVAAALVCFLIPLVYDAVDIRMHQVRLADPETAREVVREDAQRRAERRQARREEIVRVRSEGTFAEVVAHRAQVVARSYSSLSTYVDWMLGSYFPLLLLGLYAGRRRIFENLPAHLPFIRRVMWWGLGLGLVGTLVSLVATELPPWPSLTRRLVLQLRDLGAPALCFFYASAITLLAQREAWKTWLSPLGAVGRMALSNYLLHAVVYLTFFRGYGLGLFGKVSPVAGVTLALLVFALQIPLSIWWLRRFRFGPAEWLWRTLTYGKLQPMRVRQIAA